MNIRHEESAKRFAVRLENKIAYLAYKKQGGNVLDFSSTYTPPEYRGRGIASQITKYALDWAREKGCRVIPSCSFVADYIEEHPSYRDLLG